MTSATITVQKEETIPVNMKIKSLAKKVDEDFLRGTLEFLAERYQTHYRRHYTAKELRFEDLFDVLSTELSWVGNYDRKREGDGSYASLKALHEHFYGEYLVPEETSTSWPVYSLLDMPP